jgi:hypothetical protein
MYIGYAVAGRICEPARLSPTLGAGSGAKARAALGAGVQRRVLADFMIALACAGPAAADEVVFDLSDACAIKPCDCLVLS